MSANGNVRKASVSRDDWETPWSLFDLIDRDFRFNLDAAANGENAKCEDWLEGPCSGQPDVCGCGLCASWDARRVWLNPPYGRGLPQWIEKAILERTGGATVVMLLPANTDTAWFERIWQTASEIRLLIGRVNFEGSSGGNPGGSMLAFFRPESGHRGPNGPQVRCWAWKTEGAHRQQ